MRVLAVANHIGSRGGLERTQLTNCRALARGGHRLDLLYVSPGDFTGQWAEFCGEMVQVEGLLPRRHRPLASMAALARALAAGRRLRPEVVYVYRYWDLPFAAVLAGVTGAAVAYHLCLPPPEPVPAWLSAALARVDTTLSVSEDTARRWAPTRLPVATVRIVLTGIDLDVYRPAPAERRRQTRSDLGLAAGDQVVLYAGRIGREKGVDVLVRAIGRLAGRRPSLRLLVVGDPSLGADPEDSRRYAEELRALADGLPVSFLGGRPDVVELLQAADVAVVPSLWPEPLSRALMEPLACGLPVVASDAGGNPEILTGWLSEWLVPAGDEAALAERLDALCDWRDRQPDLGDRCRKHAEEHLSLAREAGLVEQLLQEAADGRRSARRRSTSPSEARS